MDRLKTVTNTFFSCFFEEKLTLGHKMSIPPDYCIARRIKMNERWEYADKQKTVDAIGSAGSTVEGESLSKL
jgi:hypothetical protein